MSDLGKRAIECCIEYDQAKKRIDKLSSKIHNRFNACEERQIKELKKEYNGPEWRFPLEVEEKVSPCLTFKCGYADYRCDDCKEALELIRERKQARQEFGIAKRRVRAVARSEYNNES